jgi:hypothetical protein
VITRYGSCLQTSLQRIPDIPAVSIVEIALCAPGPAGSSEGLIDVKFQRLRCVPVVDVELTAKSGQRVLTTLQTGAT